MKLKKANAVVGLLSALFMLVHISCNVFCYLAFYYDSLLHSALIEGGRCFGANMLANTMNEKLGIVRDQATLEEGIAEVDYYLSIADKISYDPNVMIYTNYSLPGILALARATLLCAQHRRESRGAHCRSDYPAVQDSLAFASIVSYSGGDYRVWLDKDGRYER